MLSTAPSLNESPFLERESWSLHTVTEVASTNAAAAQLPAWHAFRATVQTAGRGRTGRPWVSDAGGLWLSAVLPCPGGRSRWAILPLAAGWAIIEALTERGATDLRLRWPNDIMAGPLKLAGLLVERFHDDTAVIGVGLNVFNEPETAEPRLSGSTARLVDLAPGPYTLDDITQVLLRSIRRAHAHILSDEFGTIADDLNRQWSRPRLVAITLTGEPDAFIGHFEGIDHHGRLYVTTPKFGRQLYDASQVALLRELE